MSNYYWSASGEYKKFKLYEFLDSGFSATNNGLCLDDLCITKSDIQFLKSQIEDYSIVDSTSEKDELNEREAKLLLEEIFKIIHNSPQNEIESNYDKFFLNGFYDKRTGYIFTLKDIYTSQNVNFLDLYSKVSTSTFNSISFPRDLIVQILNSNKITDQFNKVFNFVKDHTSLVDISSNVIIFTFSDNTTCSLLKVNTRDGNNWKVIYEMQNIKEIINTKFSEYFNSTFLTQLNNIDNINFKDKLLQSEYANLIDNLKIISIQDGLFNFDTFKSNFFIKKYNQLLNLDFLTKEYFDQTIYIPSKFEELELSENKIDEIKEKMSIYDISSFYYLLDETTGYSIRLFRVKYNNVDESFKWQILFLQNISF